uniref:Tetratricopeptide repeat domain 34 n=1 Tax=Cyprinus carpio TaxID=7962 RepID=A0A8C2B6B2_CYPCA
AVHHVARTGKSHDSGPPGPKLPIPGVHALALLLMELQPGADGPQILTADALYHTQPHVKSHIILSNLSGVLQLLKKLINSADTSCLWPLLSVTSLQDRALLEKHCHTASKRILCGQQAESAIREAVAYLFIAIMASGNEAIDSLLERARCYVLLGQWKTAIFDFTAVLKEHPDHVQALCGRGFTYLMLNQQKLLREAFLIDGALMNTDCREPRWHLLYIDTLLAKGEVNAAGAHLKQVFGQEPRDTTAKARWGVGKAWQQNYKVAANYLSVVSEKEQTTLDFLITLLQSVQRKRLAQAASQQASSVSESGQWEQALALLTLAVRVVSEMKLQAACSLSVPPGVWTEDLCRRGSSLLLCSHKESGLQDFSQALDLHEEQALLCVEAGLGTQRLAEMYLCFALQNYGQQKLKKAWLLTETGLKVDSSHVELCRLRARIKIVLFYQCFQH